MNPVIAGEMPAALKDLPGPYAAKLQSPQMPHKSEHGAVRLGLKNATEAAAAVDDLLAVGRGSGVEVEGVLLETMVGFDLELIAGLRHDPIFGPLLMVGRGGVEVELEPDVAMGFLPLDSAAVERLLRQLRCARLMDGFRGRPPVDVGALAQALAETGARFLADPALVEIEINPLVVRGSHAVALDALVTKIPS